MCLFILPSDLDYYSYLGRHITSSPTSLAQPLRSRPSSSREYTQSGCWLYQLNCEVEQPPGLKEHHIFLVYKYCISSLAINSLQQISFNALYFLYFVFQLSNIILPSSNMHVQLLSVTLLLGRALAGLVPDTLDLQKRCTAVGQSCSNGQPCCGGSGCSWPSSICTLFGSAGQTCGNSVPCLPGLGCSIPGSICTPWGRAGAYCGNAVPCEPGLGCSTPGSHCTPFGTKGQYCGNGVPCVAGLSCNWPSYTCG